MLCRQGKFELRGASNAHAASGGITDFGLFFLLTGWLLGWGDSASGSSSSCLQVHAPTEVSNFWRLASRSDSCLSRSWNHDTACGCW